MRKAPAPPKPGSPAQLRAELDALGKRLTELEGIAEEKTAVLRALRESEDKYRTLMETANDAIFVGDGTTGKLIAANRKAGELIGIPAEQMIGMHQSDLHPPEQAAAYQEVFRNYIDSGQGVTNEELLICRRDGRRVPVEISASIAMVGGRPILQGIFRDISARKQGEEALRHAKEELENRVEERTLALGQIARTYRELVEFSPGLIWSLDTHGRISFANGACERAFGFPPLGLLGQRPVDLLDPEAGEVLRRGLATPSSPLRDIEARFRTKTGGELRLVMSLTPSTASDGTFQGAQCSAFDDTERALAQERLQQQEAEVRQLQKMEAVGRLAGGVAHDFNNLLTVMKGFAQMSVRSMDAHLPAQQHLAQVLRALERGASLTQRLLAFSRRQTLQPRVIDLNEVVTDASSMLRTLIGDDVQLVTRLAPGLGPARVDPGQLDQVIINLAINARDAMPGGGVLTIETMPFQKDDEAADAPSLPDGHYVVIAITDTGTGMPPAVRARLFEPFFTTKAADKGTGLGLSTAYGIVRQSGGAIAVQSEVGRGSTFRVILPMVAEAPTVAEEGSGEPTSLPHGSETVMVVEDEEGIRMVVCMILRELGYTVIEAADPNQALVLGAAHPGSIQLLVTDVVMPRLNGKQLALGLASSHPEMRVLYMSGYRGDAFDLGRPDDRDLVQKPFSLETITQRIREVLDRPPPTAQPGPPAG